MARVGRVTGNINLFLGGLRQNGLLAYCTQSGHVTGTALYNVVPYANLRDHLRGSLSIQIKMAAVSAGRFTSRGNTKGAAYKKLVGIFK